MEMTKGNLFKSIMIYSIPLMFTNLLQIFFNLADIAVVGRFAGPISLGAVGSTTILVYLLTGWLIGMGCGVNSVTALFIGAKEREKLHACVHTSFILCTLMGFIIMILGLVFSYPLLSILGTKNELIDEALLYLRIYMLGCPALGLFNYGNAILSAAGDTKKPLRYLFASGVLNIILNLIFVIVLHMKADGVALASIISQYFSAYLVLRAIIITKEDFKLTLKEISFDRTVAFKVLKIGIPASLQYSMFNFANLFVQSAVNSFDHIVVEGYAAAANSDSIVYNMMAAFYTACTSFTAQNLGAGKKKRILDTYLITTLYSAGLAAIIGGALFIFRYEFLGLFTSDTDVIKAGAIKVGIMCLSYWISAFMDNATAACNGLGKTFLPTVFLIIGSVIFRIVWIFTIFSYFHTLQSLFLLYAVSWTFTALLSNIYYFSQYKRIAA